MAQTKDGAKKAKETMRKRYGDKFFTARAKRATDSKTKHHFEDKAKASEAGKKGASKRWTQ